MFFEDRYDASSRLAAIMKDHNLCGHWDVVGIARGGVIIAKEIAKLQGVKPKPLCVEDLVTERFVLAVSSLGSGVKYSSNDSTWGTFIPSMAKSRSKSVKKLLTDTLNKQKKFSAAQITYAPQVILCDDGIVTGRTFFTAVQALKYHGVRRIIAAIPVVPAWFLTMKIEVITWRVTKMNNPATGMFYKRFEDTSDAEVKSIV